ncbi:quinon protein alcohol dehydrogenase-like superfamily [Suillus bovinus]|uniref:quinon protein alcohol dehydrogenase-like superfamily n=1 Tax=Suillus bovinus TaxID=48563 RepID=UPI001B882E6E|nr:quinon protein alcohol dehydrogenase-like superfamily [Suillus bovinus]KAG2139793.1 quinon protein alcohol dehydrogenase-like superfamily [Suillus bovinus]
MSHPPPAKHENSATMPYRKIKVHDISHILHLPGGRVICHSWNGSFRVWDLETGIRVEEWENKDTGAMIMALSPGSKTIATGDQDDAVKLWDVDTGNVIKTLTGHTGLLCSMSWSSDGGRVVCGSRDGTFRVWDVKSGETILGPINAAEFIWAVRYSPDGKMIATVAGELKIWDANLRRTAQNTPGFFFVPGMDLNGKNTYHRRIPPHEIRHSHLVTNLSASSQVHTSLARQPVYGTSKPINSSKTLHHPEYPVWRSQPTFSADGKFLVTSCEDGHLYTWDVSAIVKEAGLQLEILDAPPQPAVKKKGASHIPQGSLTMTYERLMSAFVYPNPMDHIRHPTPAPRQRALSRFSSLWRDSNSHRETDHHGRPQSHPLSWTRNLGILRRRDASGIELQEVEVPYTAGKPRNYHARKKKPVASSSRASNTHTTQPSSSSQPPPSTAACLDTFRSYWYCWSIRKSSCHRYRMSSDTLASVFLPPGYFTTGSIALQGVTGCYQALRSKLRFPDVYAKFEADNAKIEYFRGSLQDTTGY